MRVACPGYLIAEQKTHKLSERHVRLPAGYLDAPEVTRIVRSNMAYRWISE